MADRPVNPEVGEDVCGEPNEVFKGRGENLKVDALLFPCGLSITIKLVEEMPQNMMDSLDYLHRRHHLSGHDPGGDKWCFSDRVDTDNTTTLACPSACHAPKEEAI